MLIGSPAVANAANTTTATTPTTAPRRARRGSSHSDSTPPSAAPSSTAGLRISPIRRGMYSGTLAIPVTRSSVSAVWRVFVSDHSGWPVTSQSLATHTSGAAAASSVRHQAISLGACAGWERSVRTGSERARPRVRVYARHGSRAPIHQVQPVQPREHPRLRTQQPGEREQRQHRRARRPIGDSVTPRSVVPSLDEHRAEHEQQVGDVHVRAHAVGEDGHAREQDQRRQSPRGAAEPERAEPVEHPAAGRQREEAERDRHVFDRARRRAARAPPRAPPRAGGASARSGSRTAAFRRARAARPRRARRACRSWRSRRRPTTHSTTAPATIASGAAGEARRRPLIAARALDERGTLSALEARTPLPHPPTGAAAVGRLRTRCRSTSHRRKPSLRKPSLCIAGTGPVRSPTSSARSRSCARCATPCSAGRSTTPTCSSARAGRGRPRWRRSSRPA